VGPSDYWLVWRLRRGDRDACCELVRRHHAGVYAYLRRLARSSDVAEDLTQDTYAQAWTHVGSLRRCASLRAWLLTIARNEFLQWVRGRRPEEALPDGLARAASAEPSAEAALLASEREGCLRSAVSRLDPALQEAVCLHYFQDLSLREVSEVLGVPAGTVKSRLNRALGELRLQIAEDRGHDEGTRTRSAIA
jgi:RNA polymerase sigma-70 factor (ECF subfamily)